MSARPVALGPPVRALRVAVLGGSSLLLAAGAHLAGGGRLPAPGVLLGLAVLLGLVAVVVTARRCRFPLLLGVLGLEQAALHVVLTAAGSVPVLGCVPSGHRHAAGCPTSGAAMSAMGSGWSASMLAGHLLAVLGTAWLLARGEAWLWGLAEQLARAVDAVTAVPAAADLALPTGVDAAVVAVPASTGAPRGPPAGR